MQDSILEKANETKKLIKDSEKALISIKGTGYKQFIVAGNYDGNYYYFKLSRELYEKISVLIESEITADLDRLQTLYEQL